MRGVLAVLFAAVLSTPGLAYYGVDMPLELAGGARAIGLAEAFLAVCDDEWAAVYNPAGLADLRSWGVTGAYASQFNAVSVTTLGVAGPWVGGMVTVVDSGMIAPELSYVALGGTASLGLHLWEGFSVGARGRAVRHVRPGDATGWAVDLAVLWRGPITLALLGEALWSQDLTTSAGRREPWPQGIEVGAAVPLPLLRPVTGQVTATLEGLGDHPVGVRVGAELWIHGLGLRAGLAPSMAALGVSLRWAALQLDWATVLHEVLGATHRASLTVRFH